MNTATEFRVFGSPGCGKTTYLVDQIMKAGAKHGYDKVFVASFTRAAAKEISTRALAKLPDADSAEPNFGTLHAHGYHAIGTQHKLAENCIKQWCEDVPAYALTGGRNADVDEVQEYTPATTSADELYADMMLNRDLMIPRERWRVATQAFASRWESWKQANGYIDYTDMLEIPLRDCDRAPGAPSVGILDEAQDASPLQMALFRKWGAKMEFIVLGGDPDQCQPAGTMVETPSGVCCIEDIHVGDAVKAYARRDGSIYASGKVSCVSKRPYTGAMYTVSVGDNVTRATSEHLWFARWNQNEASQYYCVYIMSKYIKGNECLRVGWCKLMNADGSFHLNIRARIEGADEAWVLMITKDKAEASITEALVSARFGIPTIMFHSAMENGLYTEQSIAKFWDMWIESTHPFYAMQNDVFAYYGRNYHCPFWVSKSIKAGAGKIVIHATCNLLPQVMLLPLPEHRAPGSGIGVKWTAFELSVEAVRDVFVYSLNVDKYHSYIADGIVTHNCIFDWAGARPEVMVAGDYAGKRVLEQSYRVPRAVHELAVKTISTVRVRADAPYKPRDAEGEVRRLNGISLQTPDLIVRDMRRYLDEKKSIMLLASCSYMLDPLIRALRAEGIAFHNPYRVKAGAWNPLRGGSERGTSSIERLLNFREQVPLASADRFDAKKLLSWYEIIKATGNVPRGKRAEIIARLDAMTRSFAEPQEMDASIFEDGATGTVLVESWSPLGLPAADIFNFFEPDCQLLQYLARPDLERDAVRWLVENAIAAKSKALEYPARVLEKSGAEALEKSPRVVIGTIHSVKGGEADAVYVSPDVSYAGYVAAATTRDAQDSMTRLKYVAFTRARESLILLDAGSKFTM